MDNVYLERITNALEKIANEGINITLVAISPECTAYEIEIDTNTYRDNLNEDKK